MVYPDSERLTYGYDAGGLVNFISGEEDGYKTVVVGTDPVTGPADLRARSRGRGTTSTCATGSTTSSSAAATT